MKFRLLLLTAALFTFGSLTSAIAQTGAPGSQPTPTPGTVPSGDPGVSGSASPQNNSPARELKALPSNQPTRTK